MLGAQVWRCFAVLDEAPPGPKKTLPRVALPARKSMLITLPGLLLASPKRIEARCSDHARRAVGLLAARRGSRSPGYGSSNSPELRSDIPIRGGYGTGRA